MRLLLIAVFAAVTTVSCEDVVNYNEGYDDGSHSSGAPVITGIYDVNDTEFTDPLTGSEFNRFIMVRGSNLSNVREVMLNDVKVDIDEIYATSTTAWLQVPASAPEVITNKIYYRTALGETEFDFTVVIPDVYVAGLYNEMAPAGTSVGLRGEYFELHGFGRKETSRVTMNGKELSLSEITDKGMTVDIPADAQPNSTIDVEWVGTSGYKKVSVPYNNREHLIFDDWTGKYWGDGLLVDNPGAGEPPVICGPYLKVSRSFGAWDWYTVFGCGFGLPPEIEADVDSWVLKFEVCSDIETPFPENGNFGYMFQLGAATNKWAWNPSSESSFNTFGKWCTIQIDLSTLTQSIKPTGWCDFILNFQPMSPCDIRHYFSGFRFEKKGNK